MFLNVCCLLSSLWHLNLALYEFVWLTTLQCFFSCFHSSILKVHSFSSKLSNYEVLHGTMMLYAADFNNLSFSYHIKCWHDFAS